MSAGALFQLPLLPQKKRHIQVLPARVGGPLQIGESPGDTQHPVVAASRQRSAVHGGVQFAGELRIQTNGPRKILPFISAFVFNPYGSRRSR